MSQPWHKEATEMRNKGHSVSAIGRALGKSRCSIRWFLNERGEKERDARRRKRREANRETKPVHQALKIEPHNHRVPRQIIADRETIKVAAAAFAAHEIGIDELMRRISA